jgi:hypothetical protein
MKRKNHRQLGPKRECLIDLSGPNVTIKNINRANTVNLGYSEPQGTDKIGSLYPKFAINDNNKINTYKNFYNAFIV